MAKKGSNTGNMKLPSISPNAQQGAGDPFVAGPNSQPREEAGRVARTGKALHDVNKKSNSTGLKP